LRWHRPLSFFVFRFSFFVKLTRVPDVTATSVTCNHCGAPLAIQPSTRFVTCTHCGSRLEIHRSGAALYTEVLDAIDQRTKEIAQDVDVIRRQNEVERLDREWAMRREELMVRTKSGAKTPTVAGGVIGAVVAVVFGIFWIGMSSTAGAPAIVPIIGIVVVIAGLVSGISTVAKASQYADEQQRYEQQRARLLRGDDKTS
jgi:transcription elongation factor Elf1